MGVAGYLAKELAKEFGNRSRDFFEFVMPAVDVVEEGSELVVMIDLPGFAKKDISLQMTGNVLSINAKRDVGETTGTVHYRQRPAKINKKVILPISVKEDEKILGRATYVDGVITIKVPLPKMSNVQIT